MSTFHKRPAIKRADSNRTDATREREQSRRAARAAKHLAPRFDAQRLQREMSAR